METQPESQQTIVYHQEILPQFSWEEVGEAIRHFSADETTAGLIAAHLQGIKTKSGLSNKALLLSILTIAIAISAPGSSPHATNGAGFMN